LQHDNNVMKKALKTTTLGHKNINKLSTADQKKVDEFVRTGFNQKDRATFKPLKLALILLGIVIILGCLARLIGVWFLPY